MPKVFTSKTQKTGEIGEHVACRYLEDKGFSIVERNYTKKWGEIDVVAKKGSTIYFIEVKSKVDRFSDEADRLDLYRPEDGMHKWKVKRFKRTILTYLAEKKITGEWQVDLIVVHLSPDLRDARVKSLKNLVL